MLAFQNARYASQRGMEMNERPCKVIVHLAGSNAIRSPFFDFATEDGFAGQLAVEIDRLFRVVYGDALVSDFAVSVVSSNHRSFLSECDKSGDLSDGLEVTVFVHQVCVKNLIEISQVVSLDADSASATFPNRDVVEALTPTLILEHPLDRVLRLAKRIVNTVELVGSDATVVGDDVVERAHGFVPFGCPPDVFDVSIINHTRWNVNRVNLKDFRTFAA